MQIPPATIQKAKQLFSTRIKLSDQFGLTTQVVKPPVTLPEFLFVGSTNVGKSSLLTSLLEATKSSSSKNKTKLIDVPRVSKWAGFTATMSVYTVGRSLRLVDSPGYGYKSSLDQGKVFNQYLTVRGDLIRQAFVLIHAKRGVSVQDREVSVMLAQSGVPFQFVVTKQDLTKDTTEIANDYAEMCYELQVPPADILSTSVVNKTGINELRGLILQSSGLLEHSSNKKKKSTSKQKYSLNLIKHKNNLD